MFIRVVFAFILVVPSISWSAPPEEDPDPHSLREAVEFWKAHECGQAILRHAGHDRPVFGSRALAKAYIALRLDRTLHKQMPPLSLRVPSIEEIGVNTRRLLRDREQVTDYLAGFLYDLVLSQVSRHVGQAMRMNLFPIDNSVPGAEPIAFSLEAAEAYFLSWQVAEPENANVSNRNRSEFAGYLLPGFASFKALAARISLLDEQSERELFLLRALAGSLAHISSQLRGLPEEDWTLTTLRGLHRQLNDKTGHSKLVAESPLERLSLSWLEFLPSPRGLRTFVHQVERRRIRGPADMRGRLIVECADCPTLPKTLGSLVSHRVQFDSRTIGLLIPLPADQREKLAKFIDRIAEVIEPLLEFDLID